MAISSLRLVQAVKIAFVGDTGMGDSFDNGYGQRTMKMIEDENVDLVVDVGDYDYWGRCTETYKVRDTVRIDSLTGRKVRLSEQSSLKRLKWQDGRHGSVEGWEIEVRNQHHIISDKLWDKIADDLELQRGERDCEDDPWDGKFFPSLM